METVIRTCVKCGTDVTHAKRFKDTAGRFFCEPCAAKAKGQGSAKPGATAASTRAADQGTDDDGIIKLADEPAAPLSAPRARGLQLFPDCGTPLGSGPICASCGFDRLTGRSIGDRGLGTPPPAGTDPAAKPKHLPRPCRKCGYDLTGLKTARCPECGTINPGRLRPRESERQTLRKMYIKPLVMIAAGLVVTLAVRFFFDAAPLWYLAYFAIAVPVGFVTYVGCSMAFIGFDEPLGVTFVRLAAVYAVTDAAKALVGIIPFLGWFAWIIGGIVYIGLLMDLMELDLEDAWIVAVVTYIVKVLVWIGAFWVIVNYF